MTTYEISAIIGYHRQGASQNEISLIIGVPELTIQNVIKEYFKNRSNDQVGIQ